ncbi:MAG: TldD/PmbA family protein [Actinomycetia bacterium]|nr:TldD/PmbA family protein [Actinomycetes bacterium]
MSSQRSADGIRELARHVVSLARADEQVEVYAARGRSTTVRVHAGQVESIRSGDSTGVGIRVVRAGRQGFASAGTLDREIAFETLDEARSNAALAEPDDDVGLVEPDGVGFPELELFSPDLLTLTDETRINNALLVEHIVLGLDPRIDGVRVAAFSDAWGEASIVSTQGVDVWSKGGSCSVSVAPLAREGDDTQIGSGVHAVRSPLDIDIEFAANDGVERALSMLGATKPESGRVAALFDARVSASLMGIVAGTLSGDRVNRGRSPFGDRLGEIIASPLLTIVDDPTDGSSLAADIHDGEGLAARRNVLIDAGQLDRFLYHSESARRAGTSSTGSAVRGSRSTPAVGVLSLVVGPGSTPNAELVSSVGEGVLVEAVNGLHSGVNAISGDISVGVRGRMIRNGQLAEPIREATMATTLQRMLLDITAVGSEVEVLPGGVRSVPMVVDSVSLSGK